jgi:pilus assembly protein CpaC
VGWRWALLGLALFALPETSAAQQVQSLTVARGNSIVVPSPVTLQRVLIGDPAIADVIPVSAQEIVVNGVAPGTTTLLFWDVAGQRTTYSVRVTRDATSLESELGRVFPNEDLAVTAVGNTLILSGETANPSVAARAVALATSLEAEAEVLDHIQVPDRGQVLLQVRFAEVSRNALRDLGAHFVRADPFNLRGDDEGILSPGGVVPPSGNLLNEPPGPDQTFSDAVNFFLFHNDSNVSALIQALQTEGNFKSLAEPNLMTLPGETASFLAGGEFPFPILQGGAQAGGISIEFREFGIRLNFTPEITNAGSIRMAVAPEVSNLDFSGGLEIGGFQIPVILSRRASTVVEVQEGQTFAIAGLLDHELTESVRKIPLLGDIPILGALFRSTSLQQSETELLVLVTPHLVGPDAEVPELPTGEPNTWDWMRFMRESENLQEEEAVEIETAADGTTTNATDDR